MPALLTKVEGKGNGIKTVLPNVMEVSGRLNRPTEYPVKFFGNFLGATTKMKDLKWIITGEWDQAVLQKALFAYIERWVLCGKCRNPETHLVVDPKKNVILSCAACGKNTTVPASDKLMNIVLKNEKVTVVDESSHNGHSKKKGRKHSADDDAAASDRPSIISDGLDPSVVTCAESLLQYVTETDPPPSGSEVGMKLAALKTEKGLKKKELAKALSRVVFSDVEKAVERAVAYAPSALKKNIGDSSEKYLIEAAELLSAANPGTAESFLPEALTQLKAKGILSFETVLDWSEGKPLKSNPQLSGEHRTMCDALIKACEQEEAAAKS